METKVDVFMKLPVDTRKRHMEKLSADERLELISAQILIRTLMQAAQGAQPK